MKKIISDNWPDLVIWALTVVVIMVILSGCKTQPKGHHVITEDGVNWYSTEEIKETE